VFVVDRKAELLSWRLGELSVVVTSIGEEEESQPLYIDGEEKAVARVLAISAESSLDLPPEGLHRRFAPAHRLVRVLEQEGLTWGILLNAYELRIVRRSEGFVSSHLAFSLLDMADDVPGARSAWKLLWGVLRGDSWQPSPSMLDEVVRLGREHQQEVGTLLGSQVPAALRNVCNNPFLFGRRPTKKRNVAVIGGNARYNLEQSRLAASGRTEDPNDLARFGFK
jgi:hypothetical protein